MLRQIAACGRGERPSGCTVVRIALCARSADDLFDVRTAEALFDLTPLRRWMRIENRRGPAEAGAITFSIGADQWHAVGGEATTVRSRKQVCDER